VKNQEQGEPKKREYLTRKTKPPIVPLAYGMDDAAIAIGVSPSNIYNLMKAGELPFTIVGRRRLVMAKDIEEFLERHAVRAGAFA
jgi:excisionase family DNA binding protein